MHIRIDQPFDLSPPSPADKAIDGFQQGTSGMKES